MRNTTVPPRYKPLMTFVYVIGGVLTGMVLWNLTHEDGEWFDWYTLSAFLSGAVLAVILQYAVLASKRERH